LKIKWSSVNTAYQKLPFTLDTPSPGRERGFRAAAISKHRQDIQPLSKGDVVLVVNDA
jgi:hypothetical protein